jgi:predicted RNA binding protein with dsRBD fold (UPF0201 family)
MPIITAIAPCHPTEDRDKVRQALLNIFPGAEIEEGTDQLTARTESADRLREIILDNHIRDTARGVMLRGMSDGGTRFTLNKQVAFVGKVSFLDEPAALGGIDVTVKDNDIEKVIDFLAESTVEVPE